MNEIGIWERQPGEGDAQWAGFQAYLQMSPRSERKCAETIRKSESTVRRWAARYDWRRRATAYDNEALADCRRELRRQLATSFLNRWKDLDELANLAADELRAKIHSASPRTLAEIVEACTEKQLAAVDKLKLLDEADGDDRELVINIVPAGEGGVPVKTLPA